MSKSVSKVTYVLDLADKLEKVDNPRDVKREIGNFLVEQILSDVGESKSPVSGRSFVKLNKKYQEFKKEFSSSAIPNLELHGDMLDSLTFKDIGGGKIEVGIFDKTEAQKADNHNKFSSASEGTKVPKRQFIPKPNESFRPAIRKEIKDIIDQAISESKK